MKLLGQFMNCTTIEYRHCKGVLFDRFRQKLRTYNAQRTKPSWPQQIAQWWGSV